MKRFILVLLAGLLLNVQAVGKPKYTKEEEQYLRQLLDDCKRENKERKKRGEMEYDCDWDDADKQFHLERRQEYIQDSIRAIEEEVGRDSLLKETEKNTTAYTRKERWDALIDVKWRHIAKVQPQFVNGKPWGGLPVPSMTVKETYRKGKKVEGPFILDVPVDLINLNRRISNALPEWQKDYPNIDGDILLTAVVTRIWLEAAEMLSLIMDGSGTFGLRIVDESMGTMKVQGWEDFQKLYLFENRAELEKQMKGWRF